MKTPLLLLHGALGSKYQFSGLKEILSNNWEVFTVDFEGHGNTEIVDEFSIERFTQNIIDFIEKKNLFKVNIFGYSMGGYVALNLALRKPHLVGEIITLGTKFNWTQEFAQKEILLLDPDNIKIKVPKFMLRLEQLHGDKWEKVVRKTAIFMVNLAQDPRLNKKELRQIENKTLICLGELDKMSTPEESIRVAHWLQNGEFRLIPGLKHPIESMHPEQLETLITQFFD